MGRIDTMEKKVHGRGRDLGGMVWSSKAPKASNEDNGAAEEARFGILYTPMRIARGKGVAGAQWTGCVTGIALSMLEAGTVDAVVCIASGGGADGGTGWSEPEPIIARTTEEVLRGRGVKPALAPSLRVLDEIRADTSIRRLLYCGVGCSVQAFRAVQGDLDIDEVFVLGTNCADNSPTPQAARKFLSEGVKVDDRNVRGYEFMQDFRVHVKMGTKESDDNSRISYVTMPYFTLPGSIAKSAIAPSCLACFDYTNALADVVVGYMGAPLHSNGRMDTSYQTLTVRNKRGETMVKAALDAGRLEVGEVAGGMGSHEKIASATVSSDSIVLAMVGGDIKEEGMPRFIGEIMATLMRSMGPKGVNFARYSIDYHILRNYLHVLDEWGEERSRAALPQYAQDIVDHYLTTDKQFSALQKTLLSRR